MQQSVDPRKAARDAARDPSAPRAPVTIKKYANRRLYNTETSAYVTLEDLAQMVRAERDFVVYDAKTSEDLTHTVLTQIILEQEGRGNSLLPINFLRQLIRFYGDSVGRLVPSYLELSLETLTREQEKFRKQMTGAFGANPFGTAAFEAMQEQARQNMAMFEKALSMFTPFGALARPASATPPATPEAEPSLEARPEPADTKTATQVTITQDQLTAMREHMDAMQRQIDRLTKGGE